MTQLVRFDWAMKYLLRNKANFDILEGFLSELLKTSIYVEAILESESNKETADDKYNRVDLLVKTSEGHHIIVEVQCSRQWDYLSRILYGTSKLVCEQLNEGDKYGKIHKIISVSIVFFDIGSGKDYIYHGSTIFHGIHSNDTLTLNESEKEMYQTHRFSSVETPQDIFPEYYFIKVTKFQDRVKTKLDEWVYFLKSGQIKPEFSAQGIQNAAEKLNVLHLSPEARRAYAKHKEASHDTGSFEAMCEVMKKKAKAEGKAEGKVEGEAIGEVRGEVRARQSLVTEMKRNGLSVEVIAKYTNLSITEVHALLQETAIEF
jgi:predicted transposase/invertase (TIGR01784 family)